MLLRRSTPDKVTDARVMWYYRNKSQLWIPLLSDLRIGPTATPFCLIGTANTNSNSAAETTVMTLCITIRETHHIPFTILMPLELHTTLTSWFTVACIAIQRCLRLGHFVILIHHSFSFPIYHIDAARIAFDAHLLVYSGMHCNSDESDQKPIARCLQVGLWLSPPFAVASCQTIWEQEVLITYMVTLVTSVSYY